MAGNRRWKMERASVTTQRSTRPRSNKYRKTDSGKRPARGARSRVWVGGYVRADGSRVAGYYRAAP